MPGAQQEDRALVPVLSAGAVFGVATSVLNHVPVLGAVAAVVGSGVGWGVIGIAVAVIVGVRRPDLGWLPRTAAVAVFYVGACLTYYLSDWLLSLPGTLRLREQVRSGEIPDPGDRGGSGLVPDVGEWILWSAASIPAALLVSGIASALLHRRRLRTRRSDRRRPAPASRRAP